MIILRDLIKLINFRRIEPNVPGMYHENSNTIRICTDIKEWFEFGIYDFSYEGDRDKWVEKTLTKEILDSEVTSISRPDDIPIIEIYINTQKTVDN